MTLHIWATFVALACFQSTFTVGAPLGSKSMILLKSGFFEMGCIDCGLNDALPVHKVKISSFWIDATPVTNRDFFEFVKKSQYKTVAESPPSQQDFPNIPQESLVTGSAVFHPLPSGDKRGLSNPLAWWHYVPKASWSQPEGAGSTIKQRLDHPAVHVAYPDAEAYCQWLGKRLPSEAEFEYAARGGLKGQRYAWGNSLTIKGRWQANIWQGDFPYHNNGEDGFKGTSPVETFPPNGYGLFDMGGNVWQWTSDWYHPATYQHDAQRGTVTDPHGPPNSFDPAEPTLPKKVQRGGSFLCSEHYCSRFLVGSRGKGEVNSSGSNIGFRCARSLPKT